MYTLALPCPTLIGRTDDLATLHLLVDRAGKGQGGVALLSGEAGIGKSRLVAEVKAEALAHDFWLLQGSCFPTDHAIPYAPLLDLLRSHYSSHSAALPPTEVGPMAQAFLPLLPDLGHVLVGESFPPTLPSLDPEQEKRRRFEVLAHFLTTQAGKHPVLLVVEDLHWSDDISLEFLHYLARRCSVHRHLLLLTYRSDEVRPSLRHFLAQLDREHLAQEIPLARLTREELEAMLRAIFALPRSLRLELPDQLYGITEGNPFFIEEVLKSLIAAGDIFYTNGRWDRKPLGELHIPRSVQDAVELRTDRLSESARRVLTLAAVAGRRFDFALLQALTKHDEDQLLTLIKELMAAQLVVEESAEQFAFRHALTRQAIYGDLLLRERKALHHRIADTLERLYSATLDTHVADLAYHFYEAGAWEKALRYAQRAGEQAQAMYAPGTAIEQVTRALAAAERGLLTPPASLYRLRGQAYETLGDFERAYADYQTTLQLAREASDLRVEWQALCDLGFLWTGRNYAKAGSYFQRALERARHLDDPLTLAHSHNRLGNWYANSEQPSVALRSHQEALTLFQQAQDQRGLADTYDLLGTANFLGGDLRHSSVSYQQAVTLFQNLDDRHGLASSLSMLMLSGGIYENYTTVPAPISFAEGLHFGEQALKIAREIGSRSAEIFALLSLGQYLGPRGKYASALQVAQEGLRIAEAIEHRQWMTLGNCLLGALSLDFLDLKAAQQYLGQALAQAQEIGSWNWMRIASGFLAQALLLQHDEAQADSILTAALEPGAAMQTLGQRLVWAARADLALACGEPDQALSITEQLIASAVNPSDEQVIPRLWKLRGEAQATLGRIEEAEAVLRAAEVAARVQGLPPLRWRISVAQGQLYRTQGRKEEAEQAFSAARALIEELAADIPDEQVREQFLRHAGALLPQVRPLAPERAARQAYGGLTAREREVAALIAQGKYNREIADMLVVSERTVDAHVSNIMFKLRFTSRRQIAAWAIEKGLTVTR
jgi:DNA-binding CsgD family transcriptional regulator